jgi:hypothetical protein
MYYSGTDPVFQVRSAHLKKLRRAEGGAKYFGVFTPKNHIFSDFRDWILVLIVDETGVQ